MASLPPIVLMGHDVRPAGRPVPETQYNTVIDVATLEATLGELRDQGYRFVSFDEFMKARHRGGVALLTFDDAYANVNDAALPVLRRLGVPALVFVIASALGRGDPFPHFLHALQEDWPRASAVADHPAIGKVVAATPHASLGELFERSPDRTHELFEKTLRPEELRALSADLAAAGLQARRTMDSAQMEQALRLGGLEFGAHSMNHRALSFIAKEEADREIIDSAKVIADLAGKPPSEIAFAYPYGFVSANAAATVARTCKAGFTCVARPVSALDRAPTLPRLNLDRSAPQQTKGWRPLASATASLRETALLYARTDLGRRVAAPLRGAARALKGG